MNLVYAYALGSTALLTVVATLVVQLVPAHSKRIRSILAYLSALAVGSLLGDSFIYLIPKAASTGWTTVTTIAVLVGVLLMIITEQAITWDDVKHNRRRSKKEHAAVSNMFGFTAQSFIDGLIIASAYLISLPTGIATTIAVVIHQLPQEISNNVILRRAGINNTLANRIGAIAVFMSFIGASIALFLPAFLKQSSIDLLAPFTAGVFIYVSLAQLLPGMLMERSITKGSNQLLLIFLGVLLIAGVKYSKFLLGADD